MIGDERNKNMTVKELLEKYTDDNDLIEKAVCLFSVFSSIENANELLTVPMEYIIEIPYITLEICMLVDKIRRREGQYA